MEAREVKTVHCREKNEDANKAGNKDNRKAVSSKKVTLAIEKGGCAVCKRNDGHNVDGCKDFEAMDIAQRRKTARSLKLCYLCLQGGHRQNSCKAKRCSERGGDHHKMLDTNRAEEKATASQNATQTEIAKQGAVHATVHDEGGEVLLATALIGIIGKNG